LKFDNKGLHLEGNDEIEGIYHEHKNSCE